LRTDRYGRSTGIGTRQTLGALLLSVNGDFTDIVSYPPARFKGILALQVRNHPEVLPEMVSQMKQYLVGHLEMSHYQGKLLLIEPHRIRIRQ
jgi:hypothetical protein